VIATQSPWLAQLNRTRPVTVLSDDSTTDIAIVGGGIAGIMTAYFTLRDTDKKVVVIEADKVAHGATGHNAGQITSYFERPLSALVEQFGLEVAARGQEAIESGWALLDTVHEEANLTTSIYRFTGHAGVTTLEQLLVHLENNWCRAESKRLELENILVAEEAPYLKEIPPKYVNLYATLPHKDILTLMETKNAAYTALVSYQKGCTNSALLSEELVGYMLATYSDRFVLYEGSPVSNIVLQEHGGILHSLEHTIMAETIVLCTNGFENFTITNEHGRDIDARFHHAVHGTVGYMAGYAEPLNRDPIAISYFPQSNTYDDKLYYYLTRRPHDAIEAHQHNLVCIGGPEKVLPDAAIYSREEVYEEGIRDEIDLFLHANYEHAADQHTQYAFLWHGLMGYTTSGVRLIGPEPLNPVLLYNLGCNGVGILPSIYGGKRISESIAGKELEPSIFDPKENLSS
jgi:glycine/D-amino acid oxidase-like deaminating enzyme